MRAERSFCGPMDSCLRFALILGAAVIAQACLGGKEESTGPDSDKVLPAPSGLAVAGYDTLAGVATLKWNAVRHPGLGGYAVYRNVPGFIDAEPVTRLLIKDTVVSDTLFKDSLTADSRKYEYRVLALGDDPAVRSRLSEAVLLDAISPATLTTTLSLSEPGIIGNRVALNATVKLIAVFTNPSIPHAAIRWYREGQAEPIREKEGFGRESSDTLETRFDSVGTGRIRVEVTDSRGQVWTLERGYTVEDRRSLNANLRELAVEGAVLEPPFKSSLREYTAWIRSDLEQVKVAARAEDSAVRSISLGGAAFEGPTLSSEAPLAPDSTFIRVVVRAENGDSNHYSIRLKRKNDGLLLQSLGLVPSGIGLGHISGRFFFHDTVAWNVDSLEFHPVATQASSDVRINGMAPQASGKVSVGLAKGLNLLDFHVITKDGKIDMHYPLTVHRKAGFWKWFPTRDSEDGVRVLQSGDGGFVLAGGLRYSNIFLMKTDAKGDTVWRQTHASNHGLIQAMIQTEDKGFALAGKPFFRNVPADFSIVRTDSAGAVKWSRTYGGPGNQTAFAAKQTPDGGFILAGTADGPGEGMSQACLMKIGAEGDSLWTRCYRGDRDNWGYAVTLTPDGGYALAGKIGPNAVFLLKTDSSGIAQWSENYLTPYQSSASSSYLGTATDIVSTASGGFVLVGIASNSQNQYPMVLKTDPSGRKIKMSVFQDMGGMLPVSVRPVPAGGYILGAGRTSVVRLDDDVDFLWSKKFPAFQSPSGGNAEPTVDGGFILVGWGEDLKPDNNTEVLLIKMDPQGNFQ